MPPRGQARPVQRESKRRSPPRPLVLLLSVVAVVGLAWALLAAPFQAPDETAHFAYVQSLAESFTLPNVPGRMGLSSDEGVAQSIVGALRGAFYPESSPPDWSRSDERGYLELEHSRHPPPRTDGAGFTNATGNPPLYYLVASVPYLIDHGGTAFGRLAAIRFEGVLLLLATTLGAWLLAGEVLGRRRLAQLVCGAVAGLEPMATYISTSVTPDALLITTWTFALWLGARVINRRAPARDAVALGAVSAVAVLTKATSYALLPPVALALLLGWLRQPAGERRPALTGVAAAAVVLGAPVVAWVALAHHLGGVAITQVASSAAHPFRLRGFLSYVWQFYLPRLPFMSASAAGPSLGVYEIWLRQLTGDFGSLAIPEPGWLYPLAGGVAALLALSAVLLLSRRPDRRRVELFAFLALALLALLVLLHVTAYRTILVGGGAFLQGRYLLPAIGIAGLTVALVISRLPNALAACASAVSLSGLLAWQVLSLSAVLRAWYL